MLLIDSITKRYGGTTALNKVSLKFDSGKIHGIVGHNGAGKSTLVKILTGVERPDVGHVYYSESNTNQQVNNKIAVVYQDPQLCGNLTVAENFALAINKKFGYVDRSFASKAAKKVLDGLGIDISPEKLISDLPVADRQLVNIARSLYVSGAVIILDEPTAPLGQNETERLFEILRRLRAEGKMILFISHRLSEVISLCDDVTVLKDGEVVTTIDIEKVTEKEIIKLMIGCDLEDGVQQTTLNLKFDERQLVLGAYISGYSKDEITLRFKEGTIIGLLGFPGSGREEITKALCGESKVLTAEFKDKNNKKVALHKILGQVFGVVPRDRLGSGVFIDLSLKDNFTIGLNESRKNKNIIWRRFGDELKIAENNIKSLKIRCGSYNQKAGTLSGGNQQKVVIGKALGTGSPILLFDEPTAGIDVQSKMEIYENIKELAAEGKSILVASQELEELELVCEEILVINKNKIVGNYSRPFNQCELLLAAGSGI